MKIEEKEKFGELTPDDGKSLYDKAEMPLYRDSYFCKLMYVPKAMTLETAQELYGEYEDALIPELPERPEPES